MAYTRVNWQDSPSTATPIDAANLNVMDAYIATLDTSVLFLTGGTLSGALTVNAAVTGYSAHLQQTSGLDDSLFLKSIDGLHYASVGAGNAVSFFVYDQTNAAFILKATSAVATFTGNVTATGFSGSVAGAGIPTTRNGSASSVPIYTGTNTPSSPPTGSIWIKA